MSKNHIDNLVTLRETTYEDLNNAVDAAYGIGSAANSELDELLVG